MHKRLMQHSYTLKAGFKPRPHLIVGLQVEGLCPVLGGCILILQGDLGHGATSLNPSVKEGTILTWEDHLLRLEKYFSGLLARVLGSVYGCEVVDSQVGSTNLVKP